MPRFTNPYPQYLDSNGDPIVSGTVTFYESGTSTFKTIYSDSEETTPISNPAPLATDGSCPNIFYSGAARVVLKDANGVQIYDRDPVGGESQLGNFSTWGPGFLYGVNDIVKAANGEFYLSLQANNQDNDPTASPGNNAFWEKVRFIGIYNAQITYEQGDVVQTTDGRMWRAIVGSNTGNNPATDSGENWRGVSNETWYQYSASFTSLRNAKHIATSSTVDIDVTQPTWVAGDYAVYANNPASTNVLRILNPSNTIQGSKSTVTAGNDLTLNAGESVHLVAVTSTELKVV